MHPLVWKWRPQGSKRLWGRVSVRCRGNAGEVTSLEAKLPHLISDALGFAAPCTEKLQAVPGSCRLGTAPFLLQSCHFRGPVTHLDAEIWHLSFSGSFGLQEPPAFLCCALKP